MNLGILILPQKYFFGHCSSLAHNGTYRLINDNQTQAVSS